MPDTLIPLRPIVLTGYDLVLRAFDDSDVRAIVAAFADPEIARWNAGPFGSDPTAEALDWLRHRADWSAGDHASWAISNSEHELLGSVSLFHVSDEQLDGEIGYWVAPGARGRRVAARGVRLLADWAYGAVGLQRLQLFHAIENVASCRTAERAGFQVEGTLRQSHRYGDGSFHDEHLHGRLAIDPAPPD